MQNSQDKNKIYLGNIADCVDWKKVSKNILKVDHEFVNQYKDKLNWYVISNNSKLPFDFIDKFHNELIWDILFETIDFPADLLEKYKNKSDINTIIDLQNNIPEDFLLSNINYLDDKWNIFMHNLKEETIENLLAMENTDWGTPMFTYDSKDETMENLLASENTDYETSVHTHEKSSIKKFIWDLISEFSKLSPEFIEKHKDDVNWLKLQKCQKHISPNFFKKYRYYAYKNMFMCNNYITFNVFTKNKTEFEYVLKRVKEIASDNENYKLTIGVLYCNNINVSSIKYDKKFVGFSFTRLGNKFEYAKNTFKGCFINELTMSIIKKDNLTTNDISQISIDIKNLDEELKTFAEFTFY